MKEMIDQSPGKGKRRPYRPSQEMKEEVSVEKAHLPTGSVWNTDDV